MDSPLLFRGVMTVGLLCVYLAMTKWIFKKSAHYWMVFILVLSAASYYFMGRFTFFDSSGVHAFTGLLLPLAMAVYEGWRRDDLFRTLPAFHWKILVGFTLGFLVVFPWQ